MSILSIELESLELEWKDRAESFAGILAICEGCFEEIKARNIKR